MRTGIYPAPTDNVDGKPRYLLTDAKGAIIVSPSSGGENTHFRYTATDAQQVETGAAELLYIACTNKSGSTVWLQARDGTSDINTLIFEWEVVAGSQVNIGQDLLNSVAFATGIYITVSAASNAFTPPADTTLFDIQGIYAT